MNGLTNWRAPLLEMLYEHHLSDPSSFHVPGHKFGQTIAMMESSHNEALQQVRSMMKMDVTELSVTDDLHDPTGVIEEAQNLAAACFGAEETYFLVGGSTAGNLAMLLACCEPGDLILVQRSAHKSILNGLALAGGQAVFLMPDKDVTTGLAIAPSVQHIEEALNKYPQAKAVLLTNPSYYGVSVDLRPYADTIHRHDKLLLVDEAHGAHYGLDPLLPTSALQAGADAVVQSTHKTLSALTMGAMLHIQGYRMDRKAVRQALTMIQSSSPSYPIMASLDIARAMVDTFGHEMFISGIDAARAFRQWVKETCKRLEIVESTSSHVRMDPLRVVLKDATGNHSGYELQRMLADKGCWVEMADSERIVLLCAAPAVLEDMVRLQEQILTIENESWSGNAECDLEYARQAETEFWMQSDKDSGGQYPKSEGQWISEPVSFSRRPFQADRLEQIGLDDAAGRIAAESVIPYPPGIPILYAGERITAGSVQYLAALAKHGAKFQGAVDPTLRTIAVLKDR
ncbi:aminotransferase class I/II-fold pyridoxal phosphate-dependent enzyme [Paenibacillus mendelii]|uniref:Aminotransferase class I/II-fold pyridoxal phosphate-dependent enzyme n=1 Tax=Paenibacillus mendelii TaxID=206163 RepID=A0ABV6JIG3_9BACL|nr:aminotransferase class I/II-fold pyridoxal phosphate-dependent enzyme [Paenibacillus mendelii]MCQ6563751.1 aminotransferase class I/II-fold pyridoxal phosphate-dependent enzyme [Paenibacillus mendelii]